MVQVFGNKKNKELDLILVSAPSSDNYDLNEIREIPAYGLGILATIAKNKGFNVGVLDVEAQPRTSLEDVANTINTLQPRYVGFGSNTPMYKNTLDICSMISRDIPIIIGGSHASALPVQTAEDLKSNNLYLLVKGPAEDSIVGILDGTPRKNIPRGLYFNSNGALRETTVKPIGIFEEYPKIDRSFFINDPQMMSGKMTSFLLSSRGCFYDCSFCSIHSTWDQNVNFRSLDDLFGEIQELYQQDVRSVKFLDDLFLTNATKLRKFYEKLRGSGLLGKIEWTANSRVNVINRLSQDDIKLLKESGCRGIGLGLESGNNDILHSIGKGFSVEESERSVKNLRDRGIKIYGYFIVGFPYEDETQIGQTVDFASNLSDKYGLKAGIVPYKLYPGSKDYNSIIGNNPSKEDIHRLSKFKPVQLTVDTDSEIIKKFLKGRERHTVLHDPNYFNPSTISPNKIINHIRDFYLRTRFG